LLRCGHDHLGLARILAAGLLHVDVFAGLDGGLEM
jgi:hypothetical protein